MFVLTGTYWRRVLFLISYFIEFYTFKMYFNLAVKTCLVVDPSILLVASNAYLSVIVLFLITTTNCILKLCFPIFELLFLIRKINWPVSIFQTYDCMSSSLIYSRFSNIPLVGPYSQEYLQSLSYIN